MKCDVCLTTIPIGSNVCPNCGYVIRKRNVNAKSTNVQNNIQTKSKYLKSRMNKERTGTLKRFKLILLMLIIGVIWLFVFIPNLLQQFDTPSSITQTEIEEMDFDDIIKNGYDLDETVISASNDRDDIIAFLKDHNYSEIDVSEHCYKYDESDPLRAHLSIRSTKNDIKYEVSLVYEKRRCTSVQLTFSGDFEPDIDRTVFQLKEKEIKELADYFKIKNAYQILKKSQSLMKKEENRYKYSNYDDLKIYMSEEYQDYSSTPYYYFYYSIGINK